MFSSWISRFGLLIVLALASALALGLTSGVAWAHGGGVPQLTNAEAGPYWVSAWTQPDPLQVGLAHITVAVSEPGELQGGRREAGSPVLGAAVELSFEPLDRPGETLSAAATHEAAANKLFYEADLEVPATGRWHVIITVAGPDGAGSAGFEAQVSPRETLNWIWVAGLGLLGAVVVGVAQRFRDQRKRV